MNEQKNAQSLHTVALSCDACILPTEGKDVNLKEIHCPEFPDGALVSVTVDGMDAVQCRVKSRENLDILSLAIPHQLFPNCDTTLTEDLIREGHTVFAKVRLVEKCDPKEQLQIDFYLDGKTEVDLTDADATP